MRTRVALIGAGVWATQAHALALLAQAHAPALLAQTHAPALLAQTRAPALLAQETVEVIGMVDPLIERAHALAARHAIPITVASLDALLASGRPDLVVIAAPTEAHAPLTSIALEAGIAVLCEKPLANTAGVGRHGGDDGRPRLRRVFLMTRICPDRRGIARSLARL